LPYFNLFRIKNAKERLLLSFKNNGLKRVAIVSTALSVGVNFPDVRYVVLFGPARSLLGFYHEGGIAGRDGLSSDVILYFRDNSCHTVRTMCVTF